MHVSVTSLCYHSGAATKYCHWHVTEIHVTMQDCVKFVNIKLLQCLCYDQSRFTHGPVTTTTTPCFLWPHSFKFQHSQCESHLTEQWHTNASFSASQGISHV